MKSKTTLQTALICAFLTLLGLVEFCVPGQAANCLPPPSGLVGWWPAEGNANDIVGGDNGTLQNGATFVPGKVGQGFRFDGTNSFLQIPDSADLKPTNVTCEAWVWLDPSLPAGRGGEQIVFKKNTWSAWFEGYSLAKGTIDNGDGTSSDRFQFVVSRYGNQVIINSQTLAQRGVWYHVAGTYDGNTSKLYVNGVAEASATPGFPLDYDTTPIFIGTSGTWAPYLSMFGGIIDEPSIYNRALSASELAALYTAGSAGKCTSSGNTNNCVPPPAGIVGWWKADGTATDSIANNNGVLQNVTFDSGVVGQAFACNQNLPYGTYSGVQIADQPAYALTHSLSIEGWVKPNGDGYVIFFRGDHRPGLDPYVLSMQGNHTLLFQITDANGNGANVGTTLPYNQWTHVAATLDDSTGTMSLYTNGVLAAQSVTSIRPFGDLIPSESPGIGIGNVNDGGNNFPFVGDLDEIALYNRALSPAEIQTLFTAGSNGKCTSAGNSGVPVISSFAPAAGPTGAAVTLSGNNFSPTAANNIVYFGAVRAQVLAASPTSLTVTVPPGATFAPLTLTVNGLVAYSKALFLPTFNGSGTSNPLPLAPRLDMPCTDGPGVVVFADLDGDGKPDLLVGSSTISIYQNISAGGTVTAGSFAARVDLTLPSGLDAVTAADVDGDGKLDIVLLNRNSNQVMILKNISTPGTLTANSFAAPVAFSTGADPRGLAVRDLDGDGRPELIVGNWGDNTVSIFRNTGASGITTNTFAPALIVAVGANPQGLAVADLDGDGLPDIITANNNYGTDQSVSVLRNTSSSGTISFAAHVDLAGLATSYSLAIGDLDGDGKLDLAVSSFINGQAVSVYRNLSTPGNITAGSFAPHVDFATGGWGNGVAIGDLDGDGKPDLAVVTQLPDHLSVFKNISTPGSFTTGSLGPRADYPTGWNPNGVAIGDLDGDGRPDIAFGVSYAATLSIYQNQTSLGVTQTCTPAPSGLVGWWPAEGNANDIVGGDNGTLQNGATFVPGKVGQGFRFDGTNSFLQIPDSADLKPTNVTCEAWVWLDPSLPAGRGGEQIVFKKNTWSAWFEGYSLAKGTIDNGDGTSSDRFQFVVSRYGNQVIINSQTIAQRGVWYHVAGTYDGNTSKLYVNGVAEASATPGFPLDYDTTPIFIGTSGTWAPYLSMFGGIIDEPSIYNRALAASELAALYTAGSAGKCTSSGNTNNCVPPPAGIVGWWKADGTATDSIANNNGVLQNVTFDSGVVGQAFACNQNLPYGTYSGVQIADQPAYALTHSLSIEGWVKPNGDGYVIFFRGDHRPGLDPYVLSMQGNHTLLFQITDANGNGANVGTTLPYNQWTHVAATLDDSTGTMSLYTNGVLAAQSVTSIRPFGDLIPSESPGIGIGNVNDGGNNFPFVGDLDEIALYNRALSPAEIQTLFTAGSNGKCTSAGNSGVPVISNLSPASAAPGTNIIIAGNNFAATPAGNIVYFGAVRAQVLAASPTSLTVTVPVGATYAPVTVTVNGLTAYSPTPFLVTFAGAAEINTSSFAPQVNLPTGPGTDRVVIGDLDGDGKPDVVSANVYDATIRVYRNTSTNGALTAASFAPPVVLQAPNGTVSYQLGLALADLDGDGRLDIVVGNGAYSTVSVFQNVSTPGTLDANSFAPRIEFPTGNNPNHLAVQDLDGDGRPEIVTANVTDNTVSVLKNLASPGLLTSNSFAPPVNFATGSGPAAVAIADLDGDGRPDLITANGNSDTSAVSVLRNVSSPGVIAFAPHTDFAGPSQSIYVAVGDLDGDGKPDLAVASYANGQMLSIYRNTSTPGSLDASSFAPRVDFATGAWSHTVAIGDLDGDGKPDLAVASELPSQLSIFKNTSTPGSFTTASLAPRVDFATGYNAWSATIGDLDGDGRPDIALGNAYDSTLSIYQNLVPSGGMPVIKEQPAAQSVTAGNTATFTVSATGFAPLTYQWQFDGTNISGATDSTLTLFNVTPALAGNYSVLVSNAVGYAASSNALLTVNPDICTPPPPDLIAWWRAESNTLDHISGNDGVLMNGTGFAPGLVGQAFNFDGASNYVQIPSSPELEISGNFTVEAWIKYDQLTGANGGTIIMKGPDDEVPADWALTISPNHKLRPHINRGGNWFYFDCSTTLQPGEWYHVAMIFNSFFLVGVVDGSVDGSMYVGVDWPYPGVRTSHNPIKIGAYATGVAPANTSFFSGEIDEVSIYNRALGMFGDTDILNDYNAGGAGKCDLPVAPSLVANPQDTNVFPGATASFSVAIGGSRPLRYQWFANNSPLAGETNATLTLPNVQYGQSGNYYSVAATNSAGSVASGAALLNVINTPPQISNPGGQIVSYLAPPLAIPFTLFDAESPASNLVVTVSSSNTNLVPNEQLILSGTDTNWTVTPTAITNLLGSTTITITAVDPGGLTNQMSFVFTVINNAPQMSGIASFTMTPGATSAPIAFTVSDAETPADQLIVTANSLNPAVVPTNNIVLAGSGTDRSVTITSVQGGTASIVLTVTDSLGGTGGTSFQVTVLNNAPQISVITAQNVPLNTIIGPLAFTVSDDQTPADQIVLTASSSNTSIVPTNQIVLGGSGTNRTVTILPGTNSAGTASVTLTATDNLGASSTMKFAVTLAQFTAVAPGLPSLTYSALAWGDYDNDGQLDLLVSGTTNGLASGAVTRIYHNTGGVFTNAPFISLTNLFKSAVAWADYDRDGRLDAVVSGINAANIPTTVLYHNNGDGTFSPVKTGFAGAYSGTLAWGDFDNDGAADLFLSGLTIVSSNGVSAVTTNIARLYRNNGDGSFTDMNTSFLTTDNRTAGPSLGTATWGDFDNDGRLDLLLVGSINNITGIAAVYRNLGGGVFSNVFNGSVASYYGGAGAWGDYDNDGWLDIAASGALGGTALYHNNRNGTFTQITSFSSGSAPSVSWGDFNNDGYLDLLVAVNTSTLYRNNGNGTFTSSGIALPTGLAAWGDFDGDGDLDLIFAGASTSPGSTTIYRNNSGVTNTPPAAPANLAAATALTNSVILTWSRPLDAQTSSNGLNYNLRVGTTPGGIDVVSPLADPVTGLRRVAAIGNAGPTNRAMMINLQKGTYYWSVQAIDTAFAGSAFPGAPTAADGTFTITNAVPVISDIPNIAIAPGTNTPGPVLPFTIGDLETFAGSLTITVRSSNTNVVATNNIVVTRGVPSANFPSNCTIRVAARTNGISVITVTVTDAQGAFASDTFTVTAEQFSLQSSNFIQVQSSLIAWGDYNNDGRLDVLIAGATNGNTGAPFPPTIRPVTQLYRNDGNGVFTPVATGLPNVTRGAAAWGDYNNDGYLDLILTGSTNNSFISEISHIYRNNGDGTFTDIGANLPGVYNGAVAWGDFDNDGRLDLLLTGTTNGSFSGAIAQIYHNNGDGTFSNSVTFPGVYLSSVAVADLDGDGDLDVVLTGMNNSSAPVTYVYRNNGNGAFTLASTLTGVYNSSVAVGDYNNDGRPDILLAGFNGSTAVSLVYSNAGNFSFVNISAGLPGARLASVAWGDFDNDGRPDILISGSGTLTLPATAGAFTRVYRNTGSATGSLTFSNVAVNLPTNYSGTVTWADFDNNGTLDILLAGTDGVNDYLQTARSQTALYRNNNNVTNTPPTAPTALTSTRFNNVITLTWAKATDMQTTNANGLKYQIRVGTNSGGFQIESPLADLNNGFRRVVQTGDASTNRWQLQNLPPGNYFWSVQAVDTAFAGSPFASESTFTVLPSPIANPDVFNTPTNTPVTFDAAKLLLNDVDPNGLPLHVATVGPASAMGGVASLYSVPGQLLVSYTPPTDFNGNDSFTYTITDNQSAPATGTVTVTVGNGGMISLNIVSGPMMVGSDFVVRFAGIPGLTYTVEAAPDLSGPWTKADNLTAPATDQGFGVGIFEFREPVGTNSTRFYRTVYPSY